MLLHLPGWILKRPSTGLGETDGSQQGRTWPLIAGRALPAATEPVKPLLPAATARIEQQGDTSDTLSPCLGQTFSQKIKRSGEQVMGDTFPVRNAAASEPREFWQARDV